MKILLGLIIAAFTISSWAHELDLPNYLKMQEALAADDMKNALAAHKTICEEELLHYKDDYKDCGKNFKNIGELRESFKQLSKIYTENGDKKEMKQLIQATCSMAKANWIQKSGPLKNPYYGKSMLECGEKI